MAEMKTTDQKDTKYKELYLAERLLRKREATDLADEKLKTKSLQDEKDHVLKGLMTLVTEAAKLAANMGSAEFQVQVDDQPASKRRKSENKSHTAEPECSNLTPPKKQKQQALDVSDDGHEKHTPKFLAQRIYVLFKTMPEDEKAKKLTVLNDRSDLDISADDVCGDNVVTVCAGKIRSIQSMETKKVVDKRLTQWCNSAKIKQADVAAVATI
jgi:hypothetical protein